MLNVVSNCACFLLTLNSYPIPIYIVSRPSLNPISTIKFFLTIQALILSLSFLQFLILKIVSPNLVFNYILSSIVHSFCECKLSQLDIKFLKDND